MLADVIIFVYEVPFIFSQKIITKYDAVNTNCDGFFITKCDTVYYKLRQVLQRAMDLLQIATGITKCDDNYKLRQ